MAFLRFRIRRLLSMALALAVLGTVAELIYRKKKHNSWVNRWDRFAADPITGYTYNPNTNLGTEIRAYARSREDTTPNIVCLGTSVSAGFGGAHHQSWPRQLETILGEHRSQPVRVYNLAVESYGSSHMARQLPSVLARRPQAILVECLINGTGIITDSLVWTPEYITAPQDGIWERLSKFACRSLLYRYWVNPRLDGGPERRRKRGWIEPMLSQDLGQWVADLEAMSAQARASGCSLYFLNPPVDTAAKPGIPDRTYYLERSILLRHLAREGKVRLVEAQDLFQAGEGGPELKHFPDGYHLRENGARLLAKHVAQQIGY